MREEAAGKLGLPCTEVSELLVGVPGQEGQQGSHSQSSERGRGQPGILRLTDWHQRGDQAQQANLRPLSRVELCSLKANPEVLPRGLRVQARCCRCDSGSGTLLQCSAVLTKGGGLQTGTQGATWR